MPDRGLPENLRSGSKASNRTQERVRENLRNLQILASFAFVTLGIIGWATYSYFTDQSRPIPTSDCPGGFSRVSTVSGLGTPIPAAIEGPENLVVIPSSDETTNVYAWNVLTGHNKFGVIIEHNNPRGGETILIKPAGKNQVVVFHTICRK